jgi:hypothetical protein
VRGKKYFERAIATMQGAGMIAGGFPSRRAAIRLSIAGTLAGGLTFGCSKPSLKSDAVLTAQERAILGAAADTLVPGSEAAGVVDFVTAMLAESDPLLCYRFVSFPLPPKSFYKLALASLDDLSHATAGKPFDTLALSERTHVAGKLLEPNLKGWKGPPAPLVYFVLRSDAIDALYGVEEAYAHLDVPYMAHIEPPRSW